MLLAGGADRCFTPGEEGRLAAALQCPMRVYARQGHMLTMEPDSLRILGDMHEWLIEQLGS